MRRHLVTIGQTPAFVASRMLLVGKQEGCGLDESTAFLLQLRADRGVDSGVGRTALVSLLPA